MKYLSVIMSCLFLLTLISCQETSHETIKKTSKVTPNKTHIEAIAVEDFNITPPFFSALKNKSIKWSTSVEKDSLKEFKFKNSSIIAINDYIVESKIVDNDIAINHGIHTGMSPSEFHAHFTNLKDNASANNQTPIISITDQRTYISCCEDSSQYWEFLFQGDSLYEINYHQNQP